MWGRKESLAVAHESEFEFVNMAAFESKIAIFSCTNKGIQLHRFAIIAEFENYAWVRGIVKHSY